MKFWNNLVFLQAAAVVSALVLTVGAILEYSHQLKLLALLVAKWICRKSTPFDHCVFRKLLLHSVGPILVVLGIAGEFIFEGRTFIVEDRQEEQARKIVGSLSDKADEADRKAKAAISDSSTALNQANAALDKAGDANQIAHGARQEADSFEREIRAAKQQADEAQLGLAKLKAPRITKPEDQTAICNALSFPGIKYDMYAATDEEALNLAGMIRSILSCAHWVQVDVKNPIGFDSKPRMGLTANTGVILEVAATRSKDWGSIVDAAALIFRPSFAVETKFDPIGGDPDAIHIFVGKKPQ